MKKDLFVTADAVHVYDAGKMVITGIFDRIVGPKFPLKLGNFGVAVRLFADKGDYGKEYDAQLMLRKGQKKAVINVSAKITFKEPEDEAGSVNVMALNFAGLTFESPGVYMLELKVGQKIVCKKNVFIKQSPKAASK